MDINKILLRQRAWFKAGATQDVERRIKTLKRLRSAIMARERDITDALMADLGKCSIEAFMCETGVALMEINHAIKNLRSWARPKTKPTPAAQFPSRSYVLPCPYGAVLIISPWNYPFLLTILPLIAAIAAGNTVVVKPSANSPATSALLKELITDVFPREHVSVTEGGRAVNLELLEADFDYIFFTGSRDTGRLVLKKAAKNLTPVTLELGGKSPCIVDETANLKVAAARIVFGKFLNCGQSCIAPDYLLVQESVKDRLIYLLKQEIEEQYGREPLKNHNYGKIINKKHFDRLCGLIEGMNIVHGGDKNPALLRIEPTILDNVSMLDPVMAEEIFGPVLPVLTFGSIEEVPEIIAHNPTPLALYHFTQRRSGRDYIQKQVSFGGGCVNDTMMHAATLHMGFGGVGQSGMGAYHGRKGFDTFTHYKSILQKSTLLDLPVRYPPYTPFMEGIIKLLLK